MSSNTRCTLRSHYIIIIPNSITLMIILTIVLSCKHSQKLLCLCANTSCTDLISSFITQLTTRDSSHMTVAHSMRTRTPNIEYYSSNPRDTHKTIEWSSIHDPLAQILSSLTAESFNNITKRHKR